MATKGIKTEQAQWLGDVRAIDSERVVNRNTQRLLQALKADPISITEITKLLSLEPGLAAKLLMICNSSFFGFPRKVAHIEEAVVILGALKLSNLVYSSVIMMPTQDNDHKKYILHSLMTAMFCRVIAQQAGLRSEIPFTAGLFHILPVIVNYQPGISRLLSAAVLRSSVTEMLENINLPISVIQAAEGLYNQNESRPDSICLRMAFDLSIIAMGKQNAAFSHIINLEHDFNRLQMSPKTLAGLLKATRTEQNELLKLVG